MGGTMSQIVPGIFVGGLVAAKREPELERNGITHLCSVIDPPYEDKNRKQLLIVAKDSIDEDLSQYFESTCLFIHDARMSGGSVLIHCACGVSRSVTITLVYLLIVTDFSLRELFAAVQGARHQACPNEGFMRQLQKFEKSEVRQRLRSLLEKRFGAWPAERRDMDTCEVRAKMALYEYHILNGFYPGEESPSRPDPSHGAVAPRLDDAPPKKLEESRYFIYTGDRQLKLEEFLRNRTADSESATPSTK